MPAGDIQRKYSKKLHKVICDNLRAGRPRTLSFRLSGVHPDNVWRWLRQGQLEPERYPEYVLLAKDIEEAIAHAESAALDLIQAAAKSDHKHWTAAAWYLERTNPAEYGRRDRVEIEAGQRPLVQLNQLVLVDPEVRDQMREVLERVAGTALPHRSNHQLDAGAEIIDVPAEEAENDHA